MSVRKHRWVTRKGEPREAWLVDYTDGTGVRRAKFFKRKKDADQYHANVKVEVVQGIHTPASRSITVKAAAADWLKYVEGEKRERATVAGYKVLVERHILPRLGTAKLSSLTTPRMQKLRDDLVEELPRPLAKAVLGRVKAIIKDAKRRGNVAQNVAADVMIGSNGRDRERLTIGKHIPNRDEIRRILVAAPEGRARALIMTAAFTGLRASELRGLRWQDVDLKHGKLHVRQRADRYNAIGRPKSVAGERNVPIGTLLVNTLRYWQLACSPGD